jgi:hypothetical protein
MEFAFTPGFCPLNKPMVMVVNRMIPVSFIVITERFARAAFPGTSIIARHAGTLSVMDRPVLPSRRLKRARHLRSERRAHHTQGEGGQGGFGCGQGGDKTDPEGLFGPPCVLPFLYKGHLRQVHGAMPCRRHNRERSRKGLLRILCERSCRRTRTHKIRFRWIWVWLVSDWGSL